MTDLKHESARQEWMVCTPVTLPMGITIGCISDVLGIVPYLLLIALALMASRRRSRATVFIHLELCMRRAGENQIQTGVECNN